MSKPLDQMTKDELIYAISDILERECDGWGHCRWCGAEDIPVNLAGEEVDPADADEYHFDHRPDCAVTYIEALLYGSYEYVYEPPKAQD